MAAVAKEARAMDERPAKTRTTPGEFMRQVQAEARKVVWPTRQETTTTAIFVAIMMVMLALFFLGIDTLFGKIVQLLLSLA
jgi:preprotein translocase subunit SecE